MNKLLAIIIMLATPGLAYASQCSKHFTLDQLEALKKAKFEIKLADKRNKIAPKLLACLGHKDPKIRDGVVYEASSYWLRNQLLAPETIKTMFNDLVNAMEQPNQDDDNFTQPFAALVFSEVVRADRVAPYLSDGERQKAVGVATRYMQNITDYRGFDETDGWRHAVAHTADVFLQLSLNKNISKAQLNQMLSAIEGQVSPSNQHAYLFGEPKRLAMAFIYIVLRGEHTTAEITQFVDKLTNPAPFSNWGSVYNSKQGLAKLHNTRHFIYSIFAITGQSKNPKLKAIQPTLAKAIKQLG